MLVFTIRNKALGLQVDVCPNDTLQAGGHQCLTADGFQSPADLARKSSESVTDAGIVGFSPEPETKRPTYRRLCVRARGILSVWLSPRPPAAAWRSSVRQTVVREPCDELWHLAERQAECGPHLFLSLALPSSDTDRIECLCCEQRVHKQTNSLSICFQGTRCSANISLSDRPFNALLLLWPQLHLLPVRYCINKHCSKNEMKYGSLQNCYVVSLNKSIFPCLQLYTQMAHYT